jgi:hypothetical protein
VSESTFYHKGQTAVGNHSGIVQTPIAASTHPHHHIPIVWKLVAVVLFVALVGHVAWTHWPRPESVPSDVLTAAAREYIRTIPGAYLAAGEKVRKGKLGSKEAVVRDLAAHARPLVDALDNAFREFIDKDGKITDVQGASDLLTNLGTALGGGK